ncbi:MAG TPA: hypothetical protein VNI81_06060 [Candidatus Limnocylindrales bacterium]|nr:hypothetical protein [Candidatus Limnocylindrales bacterium]
MRGTRISSLLKFAVVFSGSFLSLSRSLDAAQEALQFNVPYHCPDGTDNIITKCQSNARGTVCFWREEKNGQLIVERFNVRGQMDGWLKICKVQSPPAAKPAVPAHLQPGQPMNPPYLSEFPTVEKVKSEIQGSTPDDTLARQVAVFTYLPQILIRRQEPGRSVRAGLTPDEALVTGAYNLAAYEMSQAFAKSHTPEEAQAFERKHGQYEMDFAFYNDWFNRLFSAAFRAEYGGAQSANAAHAKAHFDAEQRTYENAKAQQAAPANAPNSSQIQPGSKQELARCIASGRPQRVCFSEVLGNGMDQLTGISLKLPSTPGLRMTGDYSSPNGFRIIFQPDKAVMSCRGVPSPQPYLVEVSETQALVKIQNGGKLVVFTLAQDGKLNGSGPIKLTGQVPAGTRTEQTMGTTTTTTTTQRELTPLEAQQYPDAKQNGQIFTNTETSSQSSYGPTGTRQVTQYVNKTVDCTVAPLTPMGPTPLPPDIESPFGLLTTIFSGTATLMQGGSVKQATAEMLNTDKAPAPGLRMNGKYASPTGLSVIFHPESAVVACGDAELAHDYFIQKTPNQILIKLKDPANPITLLLKPDGSLFSDAAVQVNGRVIVGTTEDPNNPFVYSPKIARCRIGTLVPGGQSGSTSAIATTSAAPIAAIAPTASPATATPIPPGSSASLAISSGFAVQPGAPNPLAGRVIALLKEDLESILRKSGIAVAPGASAARAWKEECQKGMAECKRMLSAMAAYSAANTKADANGKAVFPAVAAGTYYLYSVTQFNNQVVLYDLKVELNPGANALTLDQSKAAPYR